MSSLIGFVDVLVCFWREEPDTAMSTCYLLEKIGSLLFAFSVDVFSVEFVGFGEARVNQFHCVFGGFGNSAYVFWFSVQDDGA